MERIHVTTREQMDEYLGWRLRCWPDMPSDPDEFWADWEARPPHVPYERWIWKEDGQVVLCGVASCEHWVNEPGLYFVGVISHNGSSPSQVEECYRFLMDWSFEKGANRFETWSRSTMEVDLAALRGLGFVEIQRNPESHLDLASFDPSQYDALIARVQESGVEFVTYRQWAARRPEDYAKDTWELEQELVADVPLMETIEGIPFDEFSGQLHRDQHYWDTMWLAVLDGRLAAATQMYPIKTRKGFVSTGLSGTRREARRRGIITALKAHALRDLKDRGMTLVTTDNEEANPMFQINVSLGFRKVYEHVGMSFRPEVNSSEASASLEASRADRPDSGQSAES